MQQMKRKVSVVVLPAVLRQNVELYGPELTLFQIGLVSHALFATLGLIQLSVLTAPGAIWLLTHFIHFASDSVFDYRLICYALLGI